MSDGLCFCWLSRILRTADLVRLLLCIYGDMALIVLRLQRNFFAYVLILLS